MFKVCLLYGKPKDPKAFEKYYFTTHMQIAAAIPNVKRVETTRVAATPDGSELPYFRTADVYFADLKTLQASMGSPEGQKTVADLKNFATGGATVFISAVD